MSGKFKMIMCTNAVRFHQEHVPFVAPPAKKKKKLFLLRQFYSKSINVQCLLSKCWIFFGYMRKAGLENLTFTVPITFKNKEIKQAK